jgi:hypothetical protein
MMDFSFSGNKKGEKAADGAEMICDQSTAM